MVMNVAQAHVRDYSSDSCEVSNETSRSAVSMTLISPSTIAHSNTAAIDISVIDRSVHIYTMST